MKVTINNKSTTEPPPKNGQQPKPLGGGGGGGGLNALCNPQWYNLNKFGRGPLDDVKYNMLRL